MLQDISCNMLSVYVSCDSSITTDNSSNDLLDHRWDNYEEEFIEFNDSYINYIDYYDTNQYYDPINEIHIFLLVSDTYQYCSFDYVYIDYTFHEDAQVITFYVIKFTVNGINYRSPHYFPLSIPSKRHHQSNFYKQKGGSSEEKEWGMIIFIQKVFFQTLDVNDVYNQNTDKKAVLDFYDYGYANMNFQYINSVEFKNIAISNYYGGGYYDFYEVGSVYFNNVEVFDNYISQYTFFNILKSFYVEVNNSLFQNNQNTEQIPAVFYIDDIYEVKIENSQFLSNKSQKNGYEGASCVYISLLYDKAFFIDSKFDSNIGGTVAIEYSYDYNYPTWGKFINCIFTNNVNYQAPAINIYELNYFDIVDTLIQNNSCLDYGFGGAIYTYWTDDIIFENLQLLDNFAESYGGALAVGGTTNFFIANSIIKGNIADFNEGGGIDVAQSDYIEIENTLFENNSAHTGGSLSVVALDFIITNTIIEGNKVEVLNDDYNKMAQGGGMYLYVNRIVITNTTISNNESHGNYGGLLIKSALQAEIISSKFLNNYSYLNGGGLMLQECQIAIIKDSIFDSNIAEREKGGGLYIENSVLAVFTNTTFQRNEGYFGSGLYIYKSKNITFTEIIVTENQSLFQGGFYIQDSSEISIQNSNFQRNNALVDGAAGIMLLNSFDIDIISSNFTSNTANQNGAGMNLQQGKNILIQNCIFLENISQNSGAAISIDSSLIDGESNFSLIDSKFQDNQSHQNGGAVFITQLNGLLFQNITLINNDAKSGSGGSLYSQYTRNFQIIDSRFYNNKAIKEKGAGLFFINANQIQIQQGEFLNNYASVGATMMFLDSNDILIDQINIYNNTSGFSGILNIEGSTGINIQNCDFKDNNAVIDSAGSISLTQSSDFTIQNSNFNNNTAKNRGGAIFLQDNDNFSLNNNSFSNNSVLESGGAIFILQELLQIDQNLQMSNLIFENNSAKQNGGAIFIQNIEEINIDNIQLKNNSAVLFNGGGIYNINSGILNIQNSIFNNCTASQNGGGLYINDSSNINIQNSTFDNNTAIQNGGGVIIQNFQQFKINDSQLLNNTCKQNGGSMYLQSGEILQSESNIFENNQSELHGGAIKLQSITNSTFNNTDFNQNKCISDESNGGAINGLDLQYLILFNSNFIQNQAIAKGGALYLNNVLDFDMENTKFNGNKVRFDINESLFQKNQDYIQSQGGSIYYKTGSKLQQRRNIRRMLTESNDYKLKIVEVEIENSQASSGGGFMIFQEDNTQLNPDLSQIIIKNNTADTGSAIRIIGNLSQNNQQIFNNIKSYVQNNKNIADTYNRDSDQIQFGYINNEMKLDNGEYTLCPKGTYLNPGGEQKCQNCEESSICEGGYIPMTPKEKYWRKDLYSNEFYECSNNPGACKGNDTCLNGHTGLMCENCDLENHISSVNTSDCSQCDTPENIITKTTIMGIILFFLVMSTIKGIQEKIDEGLVKQVLQTIWGYVILSENQLSAIIKIFIMHNQIIALTEDYQMELPQFYRDFSGFIGNPAQQLSGSLDCLLYQNTGEEEIKIMGFKVNMVTYVISFVVLVGLLLFTLISYCINRVTTNKLKSNIVSTLVCFFITLQPGFVLNSLKFTQCRTVGDDQYVVADTNLRCDDEYYLSVVLPVNIFLVLLFGAIIPLLILWLLIRGNKKDKLQTSVYYQRAYGIFYLEHRKDKFYWEFVTMIEKMLIVVITNLFNTHIIIKGSLTSLVIVLYSSACFVYYPFKLASMNRLSIIASIIQVTTLLLGICLYNVQDELIVFKNIAFFVIILLNLFFLCYLASMIIPQMFNRIRKFIIILMAKFPCLQKANDKFNGEKLAKLRWRMLKMGTRNYIKKYGGQQNQNVLFFTEQRQIFATMHIMNVIHGKTKRINKSYKVGGLRNSFNIMYNAFYNLNDNITEEDNIQQSTMHNRIFPSQIRDKKISINKVLKLEKPMDQSNMEKSLVKLSYRENLINSPQMSNLNITFDRDGKNLDSNNNNDSPQILSTYRRQRKGDIKSKFFSDKDMEGQQSARGLLNSQSQFGFENIKVIGVDEGYDFTARNSMNTSKVIFSEKINQNKSDQNNDNINIINNDQSQLIDQQQIINQSQIIINGDNKKQQSSNNKVNIIGDQEENGGILQKNSNNIQIISNNDSDNDSSIDVSNLEEESEVKIVEKSEEDLNKQDSSFKKQDDGIEFD